MRGTKLAVLAGSVVMTAVCGCSLPEVLPLHGGTTSGPSPYGVWYEQHWATNAVLLAAADQPEGEAATIDETSIDTSTGDAMSQEDLAADAPVEASAATDDQPRDFDASTPFQFPSSEFAPPQTNAGPDVDYGPAPAKAPSKPAAAPPSGGSIRY